MKLNNLSLYLLTVLIWGSTWIGVEFQLPENGVNIAPQVSVFYRYCIASLVIFIWCKALRLNLKFDRRTHLLFLAMGLLMFCLNYIAVYVGQGYIVSALMAIIFSTISFLNIMNARLFFGTKSGWRVIGGAALGMAGLCFMFWPSIENISLTDATLIGAVIGLIGAYIASLGNMVSQYAQKQNIPVMEANAWAMLYGAILTGLICLIRGQTFAFDSSPAYIGSLLYLAIFGSVIAFWAYLTLLGRIGANKAGYATVAFPVIAITLSVLFEGLDLSAPLLIGMVMVLVGNLSIITRKRAGA